jgi:hypothetical protein
MIIARRCLFAAMAIWLTACAAAGATGGSGRDRTRLTAEELAAHGSRSLYDVIRQVRPQWLASRGPTTLGAATDEEVVIYRDGAKLGGPSYLRDMTADLVASVQYLTGPEAASRYGLNHQQGAIVVTSKKR